MRSCRCSTASSKAFTLLEVVVGLTLMASLLVGALLAFTSHRKQQRRADDKLQAVMITDALLVQMTASRDGIPVSARGRIASKPDWYWQTAAVGMATPMQLPLQIIRLQIVDVSDRRSVRVLTSVDVAELRR